MSTEICPQSGELVEERINRVLTQYRESTNLLFLLRTYLSKVEQEYLKYCDLPTYFDIDTATGDQLTILGKRLGWTRCHCICDTQPTFGFDCEGVIESVPVSGFCDGNNTWFNCGVSGTGEICIVSDDLYRKFLKVRIYQYLSRFSIADLSTCVLILWGSEAKVIDAGRGRVVVAPGRELDDAEISVLQLYSRVLPVALGVEVRYHFGNTSVFGFGDGWGGFCEPLSDEEEIITDNGEALITENDEEIITGPLTEGATWMCEINVEFCGFNIDFSEFTYDGRIVPTTAGYLNIDGLRFVMDGFFIRV